MGNEAKMREQHRGTGSVAPIAAHLKAAERERKRAEEELRESEERYRSLFDNMLDGFAHYEILVDENNQLIDFVFLEVNDAFERLTGLKREEVIGRKVTEAIPGTKEAHPELLGIYGKVALTGEPAKFDLYFEPLRTWFTISTYSPRRGYFVTVFENINERKRAEEALRESEERYRTLFEDSRDAIFSTSRDGKLVDFNQCFVDLFCYTREELMGLDIQEIYCDPVDRYRFQQEIEQEGFVRDYEVKLRKADGAEMDCLLTSTVRRANDGSIWGYQGIARDITERKRAQEALRAFSRRLVEVQEAERHHISRELHDQIGQALTGLKLLLEMAARFPDQNVGHKLSEARALVNELMARVRNISLDLRPAMLDDLGLLPALLEHFEQYTTQTHVRVSFKHSGLHRRFTPEVRLAAYRIVQEALTNVARHAGVSQVAVQLWANKDTLCLRIEDQGIGFDAKAALAGGASSGLAGMRERAVLLGGQLTVESASGAGTSMMAELPLRDRVEKAK